MLSRTELSEILASKFHSTNEKSVNDIDSIDLVTLLADVEELLKENEINKRLMSEEFFDNLKDNNIHEMILDFIYE